MGNGSVPANWGPDRPTDTGSLPAVPDSRPGTPWLRLAAVVGVLALIGLAVLVGFYLGRTDPDEQTDGAPGDGTGNGGQQALVEVAAATDFDPDDPNEEENSEQAPLAVDGKGDTAWRTQTYFEGPALAPYRSGVGLLLDLGEEQEVGTVQVSLVGGPYDVELLATPEGTGSPPSSPDGLVDVAARSGASGRVQLGGDETVVTRFLVVWLTALPPTEGGFGGGISEITVRS